MTHGLTCTVEKARWWICDV